MVNDVYIQDLGQQNSTSDYHRKKMLYHKKKLCGAHTEHYKFD